MEKEIVSSENKGLRSAQFVVEVLVDDNNKETFVIRTPQGQPIKVVNCSEDVAQFLDDVISKAISDHE